MRAFEFLTEDVVPKKVGREFNHLEDLVFAESNGVLRAIKILRSLSQGAKDVSIKWDGSPTVYWGRDEDGTFRMVGKNNWGREEGKSSNPKELEAFINSRGKGEDWRPKFAADMAAMWPYFEAATPSDFRGYIFGDILFHPGKPYQGADGRINFTPNLSTYSVKGNSNLGRSLAGKKIAVAAHKRLEAFGDKDGEDFDQPEIFNGTKDLMVFGQTYVSHKPAVDADNIEKIQKLANKYASSINNFLAPVAGMGYLQNAIYTYVNTQAKEKQLDNISEESFFNWLLAQPAKYKKIKAHSDSHPEILSIIFTLVKELMLAKNEVIRELDQAEGDITAHTKGEPGGEGYVKTQDGVKLVPRHRWTPFRSD